MSIFDFFKPKTKKEALDDNVPDEEYQLPELSKGNFYMTNELRRRYENELLMEMYDIKPEKQGEFV